MKNRRSVLKYMMAAPAAPAMAKIAESLTITQAVSPQVGALKFNPPSGTQGAQASVLPPSYTPWEEQRRRAYNWFIANGKKLPDHVERTIRRDTQHVSMLDPDIASKRSWSLNVKVATQRQRNYEKAVEQHFADIQQWDGKATLQKLLGWDWPW